MIAGIVTADGVPMVELDVAGQTWDAIVDTGFNGDFELPTALHPLLKPRHRGQVVSVLAGGQSVVEEFYDVDLMFDGEMVSAEATFVPQTEILVGTGVLRGHRLEIDFPNQSVHLERTV